MDKICRLLDRFDTRAFIAIALVCSMIALTFVLALSQPQSDPFKILLGAMLTVGFASAIGWYFNATASGDKANTTALTMAQALPAPAPASPTPAPPAAPVVIVAWWSLLLPAEQAAITAAAAIDPRVQAFVTAANAGTASADDLAYLVAKNPPLLTQARAAAILSA